VIINFLKKYYGYITIVVLALLFSVKLYVGKCMLWICAVFVITVISYFIAGDFLKKEK